MAVNWPTFPVRVTNSNLLREVRKADPEWDRDSRIDIVYRFSDGRIFEERTDTSGPYAPRPAPDVFLAAESGVLFVTEAGYLMASE